MLWCLHWPIGASAWSKPSWAKRRDKLLGTVVRSRIDTSFAWSRRLRRATWALIPTTKLHLARPLPTFLIFFYCSRCKSDTCTALLVPIMFGKSLFWPFVCQPFWPLPAVLRHGFKREERSSRILMALAIQRMRSWTTRWEKVFFQNFGNMECFWFLLINCEYVLSVFKSQVFFWNLIWTWFTWVAAWDQTLIHHTEHLNCVEHLSLLS